MLWLFSALFSSFMYSVTNVLDQFIRRNHIRHNKSVLLIWMFLFFVLWLSVLPFIDISIPPPPQLAAAVLSGVGFVLLGLVYFEALSNQEASRVIPMFQINAVFVLLLSTIFLGEILTLVKYAGFATTLLAGLVISAERSVKGFTINRALFMVMGSSAILAVSMVLLKFFYLTEAFWNGFFWVNLGSFLTAFLIAIMPGSFRDLRENLQHLRTPKVFALVVSTTLVTFVADFLYLYAIDNGPVSLVSIVASTQIAMLFVLTLFLSHFFPKVLKERTDRKTLLTKATAIGLMIVGLFLLKGGQT